MTIFAFTFLLIAFSSITSLVVEAIKKIMDEKENLKYNLLVLIVAIVVGVVGTIVYFILSGIPITMENILFAVAMGFFSAIGAMVGYDRVKQAIEQFGKG